MRVVRKNVREDQMKMFEADKGLGLTAAEAKRFLVQYKSLLLLGSADRRNNPNIHPLWYYFDSITTKFYFYSEKTSKKVGNIKRKQTVYFDVSVDRFPYKGVRGSGNARIVAGKERAALFAKKILARYIKASHPMVNLILEGVKKGDNVVVEISPEYFSTWDYGKMKPNMLRGFRRAIIQ